MNELVTQQQERGLAISTETKELIQSSIADSTLKRYQRLSKQIEAWLKGARVHQWSFAQGRQCCLKLSPGGSWQRLLICRTRAGGSRHRCRRIDAKALARRTGSGRKVLLWERDGVIEMRGCLDFACGVIGIEDGSWFDISGDNGCAVCDHRYRA